MTGARIEPEPDGTGAAESGRAMAEVRAEIDRIDREIVALLAERAGCVRRAAHAKGRRADIVDSERIEDVIAKTRGRARDLGLSPELVEPVYRLMIERFIELEKAEFDRLHGAPTG